MGVVGENERAAVQQDGPAACRVDNMVLTDIDRIARMIAVVLDDHPTHVFGVATVDANPHVNGELGVPTHNHPSISLVITAGTNLGPPTSAPTSVGTEL